MFWEMNLSLLNILFIKASPLGPYSYFILLLKLKK